MVKNKLEEREKNDPARKEILEKNYEMYIIDSEKRMECEENMLIMAKENNYLQDNMCSVTCKAR